MPLGTLDNTPPPFFRQGLSALSKLTLCAVLAVGLMLADTRLDLVRPLRASLATVLAPLQWVTLRPLVWGSSIGQYFASLKQAQSEREQARNALLNQAQRAAQVEQLTLENRRLRELLGMRARVATSARVAQVLYDAADPYTRKVIIDRGAVDKIQAGAPVIDERGVLGQVTRVYPVISEVTLVTDREQATPVLNTRTGARGVTFGDSALRAHLLELRYMAANADVQSGDLLTTSGVDGVYPPGLPVARVDRVERRGDSAFARIALTPLALVGGAGAVLVLDPIATQVAPRPAPVPSAPASTARKGGRAK